jgi:hypothetical protein
MKLTGWHRLWMFLSAVYFILISLYVFTEFPKAENTPHQPEFYKKLSSKNAAIIWPNTHEDALALGQKQEQKEHGPREKNQNAVKNVLPEWAKPLDKSAEDKNQIDFRPIVEMPNKHIIEFKNGSSDEDMNAASNEYWRVVEENTNWRVVEENTKEKRLNFLFNAFLFWITPCILLYIAGRSIHWVYKGFKPDKENQTK